MENFDEKHLIFKYVPSRPPLHNFKFPGDLRWGYRKFLKCAKVDSPIDNQPSESYNLDNHKTGVCGSCMDHQIGIAEVRDKVILDLHSAAGKINDLRLKRERGSFEDHAREGTSVCLESAKPEGGGKNFEVDVINKSNVVDVVRTETSRQRSEGVATRNGSSSGEKKRREKFSVGLTRAEIEEDFMAMVGHKPRRRPKKRAKNIQKQLDTLFPGLGLTEITADMYKVDETQ